ncbi:class I SAM-dependent methyltransferase [Bradyrhizobium guangzhouense]|uniref:Class I SAM-dependent methyltransferase n=1 Tax=Bradyrhizobium guangzhouense TaxID=1325095 RepID=A0AAE6C7V7_9BRAD|nr:class I SAM-dependent methyltransferase [Bradyrhizobium guangzhouense]QAU45912.1 class I SAM-dependent methyltransferase [Bradyrhizobium guangzhouense]
MNTDSLRQAQILSDVAAYYATKLEAHGATARGVDWNGPESHQLRHRQFLRLIENDPDGSIIDLGCGFGDFLDFLRRSGHRGPFIGYDIAPDMIEAARSLHGEGEDRRWHVGAMPAIAADFAIASGVFNVKGTIPAELWLDYIHQTMDVLADAGRKGFGFNILSLSSDEDRRRPNLYYADPSLMLGYCLSRYGRSVALLQDYGLYEFTILVRHP